MIYNHENVTWNVSAHTQHLHDKIQYVLDTMEPDITPIDCGIVIGLLIAERASLVLDANKAIHYLRALHEEGKGTVSHNSAD